MSKNVLKNKKMSTATKHFKPHMFNLDKISQEKNIPIPEFSFLDVRIEFLHTRNCDFLGIQVVAYETSRYDSDIVVQDRLGLFESEKELLETYPTLEELLKGFSSSCNWRLLKINSNRILVMSSLSGNENLYTIPSSTPVYSMQS